MLKRLIDLPPTNAGVRLQNGQAVAAPASPGRELDIPSTIGRMTADPGRELADGEIDLQMLDIAPTVTDAAPLVAQANAILTSPFTVNPYDPIRDEWLSAWVAQPEEWATWLTADSASGNGLTLTLNTEGPAAFLQSNAQFGDERYIDVEKTTAAMRSALGQGQTTVTIRIWHGPTSYSVQGGQTLASIAEEVGIPYPYIQAANPDINTDALSVGQVLTLPSKDMLVPLDPIPNKRIVIDRSEQHMWAYENGQIVFDWVVSTGISSSPTALGVFQYPIARYQCLRRSVESLYAALHGLLPSRPQYGPLEWFPRLPHARRRLSAVVGRSGPPGDVWLCAAQPGKCRNALQLGPRGCGRGCSRVDRIRAGHGGPPCIDL